MHCLVDVDVTGDDQRRAVGPEGAGMLPADVVAGRRRHRRDVADAWMAVGMRAVDRPREGAVGQRGGLGAHLAQAVETQRAHTIDIPLREARPPQQVGQQVDRAASVARQGRDAEHGGVGPHLDVGVGADACQDVGQARTVEIASPIVEQVGGESREAGPVGRIGRRAAAHQRRDRDHRRRVLRHDAQIDAAGRERRAPDGREAERPRRAGHRQRGTIHHRRHTGVTVREPGSASSRAPRGTTLSATPGASRSHRRTAAATDAAVARV